MDAIETIALYLGSHSVSCHDRDQLVARTAPDFRSMFASALRRRRIEEAAAAEEAQKAAERLQRQVRRSAKPAVKQAARDPRIAPADIKTPHSLPA